MHFAKLKIKIENLKCCSNEIEFYWHDKQNIDRSPQHLLFIQLTVNVCFVFCHELLTTTHSVERWWRIEFQAFHLIGFFENVTMEIIQYWFAKCSLMQRGRVYLFGEWGVGNIIIFSNDERIILSTSLFALLFEVGGRCWIRPYNKI